MKNARLNLKSNETKQIHFASFNYLYFRIRLFQYLGDTIVCVCVFFDN